jgi:photosystem II stability/assembly factor-like uncharacterized protein
LFQLLILDILLIGDLYSIRYNTVKNTALVFRVLIVSSFLLFSTQQVSAQFGYWTNLPTPQRMNIIYDIDMWDTNFGICVGPADSAFSFAGISYTHDGGASWNGVINDSVFIVPLARSHTVFQAVHIVSPTIAWVSGDSGQVYFTMDAGQTWTGLDSLYIGPHCTYRDIHFADEMNGVIVGGDSWATGPSIMSPVYPPLILRTYDGGLSWKDESPITSGPDLPALHKVKHKDGKWFCVGDMGNILEYTGAPGSSGPWAALLPPNSDWDHMFLNLEILDGSAIAISGSNRSSGNGQGKVYRNFTWNSRFSDISSPSLGSATSRVYAIDFLSPELGWIGASQTYTAVTTNGGGTWKVIAPVSSIPGQMRTIDFIDSLNGFAAGSDIATNTCWIMRYYGVPPKSDISYTKTDVSFPQVRCEDYVESELVIKNTGNGTLIINQGEISFSSNQYNLEGVSFPLRIAPNKGVKVTIRWYPSAGAVGDVFGTMTIHSNDPDHSPWTVSLSGKRFSSALTFNTLIEAFTPKCLFESTEFSTYATPQGNEKPTFISIDFVSGDDEFVHLSPDEGTQIIDPTEFRFSFTPTQVGTREGIYRIIAGNPNCPDTSFVTFRGLGLITELVASATTVDFGEVCIGQTKDLSIDLKNIGNTVAYVDVQQFISGIAVFPPQYSYAVVVFEDSTKPYRFQFAPQITGDVEARIRLVASPCNDTIVITLKGRGISTEVKFSPSGGLAVGPTIVNRTVQRFVRIRNTGKTNAFLSEIKLSKAIPGLELKNVPLLPKMLNPLQEIEVLLEFKPTYVGDWTAKLVTKWDNVCADSTELEIQAVCVPNPEIDAPSAMDLGTQPCPTPIFDTLYIRNRGNGPLVFSLETITGADKDHFKLISPAEGDTAFARDSIPFIVQYNSPLLGESSAVLILSHNDIENTPTTIDLSARRIISEFVAEGDSATEFFTRLYVSESRNFAVRNTSNETVVLHNIEVQSGAGVFSVTKPDQLPVTLLPGQAEYFNVDFTPNGRGPFTGVIVISGQPCDHTVLLTLHGSGDTDGLSVDKGNSEIVLSPCNFVSACDTIRLANQGIEPITVSDIRLDQSNPVLNASSGSTPFIIQPGGEAPIIICADPAYMGVHFGDLLIESNDPAYPLLTVHVRSSRDSASLTISADVIDFGTLPMCVDSPSQSFGITNTGDYTEQLTITRTYNGPEFDFPLQTDFALIPGKTATFKVEFKKTGNGVYSDTVFVGSSSCPDGKMIILKGEWSDQRYTVAPANVSFPNVNVGSKTQRSFTVVNHGAFNGEIKSISITPAGPFSVIPGYPNSIAGGSNGTIQIEFEPALEGNYNATICLIFDNPCVDTVCVDLDGAGVQGDLVLHPNVLNFGVLAQCQELQLEDTLRNEGSGEISLLASLVIGPDNVAFTVLNPVSSPEVVSPGGERIFSIVCKPALLSIDGPAIAALSIQTSDNQQPIVELPLEVTRETFIVAGNQTISYGTIEPNKASTQTITLTNSGSARYCYEQPVLPPEVTLSVSFPLCLNPGESVSIDVNLTPAVEGDIQQSVALLTNQPCNDSTILILEATVQEGIITQTDRIDITAIPYCWVYGFTIQLDNGHIYTVTVDSVTLAGPDMGYFAMTSTPATPFSIASGANSVFMFQFKGLNQNRLYSAQFISYLTVNGQQVVKTTNISAESSAIIITATDVIFPLTVINQTSSPSISTVSNNSNIAVDIAGITSPDPAFVITQIQPQPPVTLQPGESIIVTLEFAPTVLGSLSATLEVQSSGPCPGIMTAALSGESTARDIVSTSLSIGALSAKVDERIRIPLQLDEDLTGTEVSSWSGSIEFNRSMLYPERVIKSSTLSESMDVIMSYDYADGKVSLTASGGDIVGGSMPLAYVECLVLIGDSEQTEIRISSDFDFTSGFARIESAADGSFTLDAFCQPEDRLSSSVRTFALHQSKPNPASISSAGESIIRYHLPIETAVLVSLHDAMGREVLHIDEGMKASGNHELSIDISSVTPGLYYYTLSAEGYTATRTMILVR